MGMEVGKTGGKNPMGMEVGKTGGKNRVSLTLHFFSTTILCQSAPSLFQALSPLAGRLGFMGFCGLGTRHKRFDGLRSAGGPPRWVAHMDRVRLAARFLGR